MFAPLAQTPRPPGTGGKRQPCGLLREAQSDPKVGSETSGGRGQRPPRRLSDRGKPGDTNAFGGAARPLRTSRRLVRAQGPAARGGGCSEARFLRRKGARNAHAVRGAGQGRTHGASGGRGDAPAAAGNGRTRRGLCRAGEGAWSGGMRRCMPQAAFLAPFRRSKRLRGVGGGAGPHPWRERWARSGKKGGRAGGRGPLYACRGTKKIFSVKEILFINEKKFFSGRGKDEESPPPLGRRAEQAGGKDRCGRAFSKPFRR